MFACQYDWFMKKTPTNWLWGKQFCS